MKKKQRSANKNRIDVVCASVTVGNDHSMTVHFDPSSDEIDFVGAHPGSKRTESYYERDSGKRKIVSSVPSQHAIPFTSKEAILAYDYVIAVDTNTRVLDGTRCAVCMSYHVPGMISAFRPNIPFELLGAYLIQDISSGVNPERIGWHITLQRHVRQDLAQYGRLAVVVDSELGLHPAINRREVGYYTDNLLPEGATFIYASADASSGTLQDEMIRMCDTAGNAAFDALMKAGMPRLKSNSSDPEYRAWGRIAARPPTVK